MTTTTSPSTPNTFHPFHRLPTELRFQIYRLLFIPRVISLDLNRHTGLQCITSLNKCKRRRPLPSLLHVNSESRAYCLRHYTLLRNYEGELCHYVNYALDIFILDDGEQQLHVHDNKPGEEGRELVEPLELPRLPIQHLGHGKRSYYLAGHCRTFRDIENLLSWFPSLVSVLEVNDEEHPDWLGGSQQDPMTSTWPYWVNARKFLEGPNKERAEKVMEPLLLRYASYVNEKEQCGKCCQCLEELPGGEKIACY